MGWREGFFTGKGCHLTKGGRGKAGKRQRRAISVRGGKNKCGCRQTFRTRRALEAKKRKRGLVRFLSDASGPSKKSAEG